MTGNLCVRVYNYEQTVSDAENLDADSHVRECKTGLKAKIF